MELIKHKDSLYLECLQVKKQDFNAIKAYISYFSKLNSMKFFVIMKSRKADIKLIKLNDQYQEKDMTKSEVQNIIQFLYDQNKIHQSYVTVETQNKILEINTEISSIDLGIPSMYTKKIPIMTDKNIFINETISILEKSYQVTCLSLEESYMVIFLKEIANLPLEKIGFYFENYRQFPEGINVVFAQITNENSIKIRIWKKRQGEISFSEEACALTLAASVWNHMLEKNQKINISSSDQIRQFMYLENDHIIMESPIKQMTYVKK